MPTPQTFNINNCNVTPNGNSAQMSITGANNQPNQGNWKNNDNQSDYDISLPSSVWSAPAGSSLNFTVTKGNTSATYTLLSTAPLGASYYTLKKGDGTVCQQALLPGNPQDPDVIINS